MLGVGVQAGVHQTGDDGALDLQAAGGDVHHLVQTGIELLGSLGEMWLLLLVCLVLLVCVWRLRKKLRKLEASLEECEEALKQGVMGGNA